MNALTEFNICTKKAAVPKMPPTVASPKNRSRERVGDRLRAAILSGDYSPGERLVQDDLARAFGVSRVPIREALRALESEGLVGENSTGGFIVAQTDSRMLKSILRIRDLLEQEAVERIPEAQSDITQVVRTMTAILDKIRIASASGEMDEVASLTRAFHFTLFNAAGDPVLTRVIGNMWDLSEIARLMYYWIGYNADELHRAEVDRRQQAVIDAVSVGNIEEVVSLLAQMREGGFEKLDSLVGAKGLARSRQAHKNLISFANESTKSLSTNKS